MFDEQPEKYLYRRQYILSPVPLVPPRTWNQLRISDHHYLSTHPDLQVISGERGKNAIHVLGFIIDPYNPDLDDFEVVQNMVDKSNKIDDVFGQVADKCGRFVVIAHIGHDFRIFSDACGLRQVFYHTDQNDTLWCSSQPHLIAEYRNLKIDEEIKEDLDRTSLFKSSEYWYPGDITLFPTVFHLTPNHFLDLNSGKVIRYWPGKRLEPTSVEECVPKVTELLTGILEGASRRYNLAFAISCGLDSRTLFSVSRKMAANIHYFTQTTASGSQSNPDVLIPSEMLGKLGLRHSVLVTAEDLDESFLSLIQQNVFTARAAKASNTLAIYEQFKDEDREIMIVFGNCSEITKRDRYRFPITPKPMLNAKLLAAMAHMSQSNIAVKEFDKWLESVKMLTKFNVDILDLMHWEQRVGNWGAMSFSEYEIIHESLCPYSCRKYIEYMLRVPFSFRTKPDYILHHEIIKHSWPEVLDFDINPQKRKAILSVLYRTHLYDSFKIAYILYHKQLLQAKSAIKKWTNHLETAQ